MQFRIGSHCWNIQAQYLVRSTYSASVSLQRRLVFLSTTTKARTNEKKTQRKDNRHSTVFGSRHHLAVIYRTQVVCVLSTLQESSSELIENCDATNASATNRKILQPLLIRWNTAIGYRLAVKQGRLNFSPEFGKRPLPVLRVKWDVGSVPRSVNFTIDCCRWQWNFRFSENSFELA